MMIYNKKCDCCDAKFTMMYSGKSYLERLKKYHPEELNRGELDRGEKSGLNNLIIKIEKGNPYMAVSMEEAPIIIKELQEAYKEYQEVQKELKNKEN